MEDNLISSIQAAEKEALAIREDASKKARGMIEDAAENCRKEIHNVKEEYRSREGEILNKAREDAAEYKKERMNQVKTGAERVSVETRKHTTGAIEFILHYIFEEHNGHFEDDSNNSSRTEG